MPRNQQPLFDILNQPNQDGEVIAVKANGSSTTPGQSMSILQTQNMITTSYQSAPVHSANLSLSLPRQGLETKPVDVSVRREQFSGSGRSDRLNSDNMPVSPKPNDIKTSNDKHVPGPYGPSHELNGKSNNVVQGESQVHPTGQFIANGRDIRTNEHKSDSGGSTSDTGDLNSPSNEAKVAGSDCDMRKHHQHYPFRQAYSEVILPSAMQRRQSLFSVTEKGSARLQEELMRAQKALERKDEEVDELRGIRERLMKEVSDFTAALFEEVNSQLNEAALSEQLAKKQLKEARAKIEVLTAEVTALKDLVLTSTPSSPNKHLNPQIDTTNKKDKEGKPFWKTHRRSTSHHQFTKESRAMAEATEHHSLLKELDSVVFDEFKRWLLQPTTEFSGQFFVRVQQEDIQPCLSFKNIRLADKLLQSVRENTLSIEPIPGDQSFPRKCCLSESHKLCNYKIKFEGDDEWYSISQMSRNRIASVCNFYAYLRYIVHGLVKCSDKDIFAELVRLRNQMAQARLGLK